MKKITLSMFALTALTAVNLGALTIYVDPKTNQLFSQPAEGLVKVGEYSPNKEKKVVSKKRSITVVDQNSPEFLLGKQTHVNMKFVADDNPDMWLKAGVRVQGTFENRKVDKAGTANDTDVYDAYLRRVRFEVSAGLNKWTSFTMDLRNDKANYGDKGEQNFNVGDAYVKIKKPFNSSLASFKLYRAKIDVSRTETVKSARVINYDRPHVADEAAQFISHNRRATNTQMYGNWKDKIHYQVAFGDGIYSGKLKDATGKSFSGSLTQQQFFYGGKIVLSPFDGWEEKSRTETYFAKGKHFEVGVGYWKSPGIKYNDGVISQTINHELINYEISAHYKGLFAQAEYFDFDGVVKAWGSAGTGKSNGWYAVSEYVFKDFSYIAPFVRYESWNKLDGESGYDLTSKIAGINWYLQGNSIKVGLAYQQDKYGKNIGNYTENRFKIATQFFF